MANCGGELFYWGTPSRSEIDFIWTRGGKAIGIEVKAVSRWKTEYGSALNQWASEGRLQKCFAVYLGDIRLKDHAIHVLPLKEFMKDLTQGAII